MVSYVIKRLTQITKIFFFFFIFLISSFCLFFLFVLCYIIFFIFSLLTDTTNSTYSLRSSNYLTKIICHLIIKSTYSSIFVTKTNKYRRSNDVTVYPPYKTLILSNSIRQPEKHSIFVARRVRGAVTFLNTCNQGKTYQ